MSARIYQPARNAMQSGQARSRSWVLEFGPSQRRNADPLMGWTGSGDTQTQVRLSFGSREEAIAYAERNGIGYVITEPEQRRHVLRSNGYGDNFSPKRRIAWTH